MEDGKLGTLSLLLVTILAPLLNNHTTGLERRKKLPQDVGKTGPQRPSSVLTTVKQNLTSASQIELWPMHSNTYFLVSLSSTSISPIERHVPKFWDPGQGVSVSIRVVSMLRHSVPDPDDDYNDYKE